MSRIYLSHLAGEPLKEHLRSQGHALILIGDDPRFGSGVEAHPDLRICKMGAKPEDPLLFFDGIPSPAYPQNASFCALVLERYLLHRLDVTDKSILRYAREQELTPVNIRQGYAKCAAVAVDGRSVITSDLGVYRALTGLDGVRTLLVSGGHVRLPGFPYGFLGGASGRVGDTVVFNGDLSRHPDFRAIRDFIEERGLGIRFFPEYPLTDIGSVIESKEQENDT